MGAAKKITLSTVITPSIKAALNKHCKEQGLKLQHFVEEALLEKLEDVIDVQSFHARKNEPTFSLEEILKSHKGE